MLDSRLRNLAPARLEFRVPRTRAPFGGLPEEQAGRPGFLFKAEGSLQSGKEKPRMGLFLGTVMDSAYWPTGRFT